MKIVWSTRASYEIDEIPAWIALDKPQNARLVALRIEKSLQQLEAFPEIGRRGVFPGSRELVVPRTPYILVYEIALEYIGILLVRRGARRGRYPRD